MTAKVFISCGQHPGESEVAEATAQWLEEQGFAAYVAKKRQTLQDVNKSIIDELVSSDYYLMIDFQREKIGRREYRGSLFTHQEMALAYYMGYSDNIIALRHEQVKLEGIAGFLLTNAMTFRRSEEILDLVMAEVKNHWSPSFSRKLVVSNISPALEEPFLYSDHTGSYVIKPWYGYIKNCRKRETALNTSVRLESVTMDGGDPQHPDRSALKWAGQKGYECVILPCEWKSFSLFHVNAKNPAQIFLASEADSHPRAPIICRVGEYILKYQVIATAFPIVEFSVRLTHTADIGTIRCEIVVDVAGTSRQSHD